MAQHGQPTTYLTVTQWITHRSPIDQETQVSTIFFSFSFVDLEALADDLGAPRQDAVLAGGTVAVRRHPWSMQAERSARRAPPRSPGANRLACWQPNVEIERL